jgi:transposase
MTYSCDFREAVLTYRQKGHALKQVCETFSITKQTYYNWIAQKQKTGTLKPKKHGTRKRKTDPQKLRQYVEEHPDAYLKELAEQFSCKTSSMYNALVKLGLTRKKKFHI